MAQCLTGQPIITSTAPVFHLLSFLSFGLKEEKAKWGKGSDHCESVFWCALISPPLLFKHEPFSVLPTPPPYFLLSPQSLSLICKCWPPSLSLFLSLPLTPSNYFGLWWGISAVVSLLQFPRHFHYSCVFVHCGCVCTRETRVKRLRLLLMRITEPTKKNMTAITTTTLSQISLGTSFDPSFYSKKHI